MAGPGSVLVVIVNFNSGPMLARSVACVKTQTYADWRLVVVDNGSSDDSVSQMLARHPDVDVLLAGKNLGFAAANNLAVSARPASAWVALLNPDAFPEPDWLQRLVDAAQTHPQFATF